MLISETKKHLRWWGAALLALPLSTTVFADTIESPNCRLAIAVPSAQFRGQFVPGGGGQDFITGNVIAGMTNQRFLRVVGRTEASRPQDTIADELRSKGWNLEYAEMSVLNPQMIMQQRALLHRSHVEHFLVVTRAVGSFNASLYNSMSPVVELSSRNMTQFAEEFPGCKQVETLGSSSTSATGRAVVAPSATTTAGEDFEWLLRQAGPGIVAAEAAHWASIWPQVCVDASFDVGVTVSRSTRCRVTSSLLAAATRQSQLVAQGGIVPSRISTFHNEQGEVIQSYEESVEYARFQRAVRYMSPASAALMAGAEMQLFAVHRDADGIATCADDRFSANHIGEQPAICQTTWLNATALLGHPPRQ